ncbi:MAG: flagellar basal body L-ring protein FlgH [Bdellovibrionaceae bacterium]|nr:flagellar basal body L-ring protein FlgH [Pseudobdellovibrionaceae bacterium]
MTFRTTILHIIFLIAIAFGLLNTGCAGLIPRSEKAQIQEEVSDAVKFSDTNEYMNMANRNYKRMTRSRMEEEAELHAQAGSMWVMEGQGAYLFAQNKSRREGDLLNVKVEGPAQKQVEMKVNVIKSLLKQLEEQENPPAKDPQPGEGQTVESQKLAEGKDDGKGRQPASEGGKSVNEQSTADAVTNVPTRIVEKLSDGNYRVKGQQPFMIGQREYKVIVTGVIRPEDFNDEGVSSNRLLDPQFDVVNIRRTEKR